jgi:hypothetical protein
MAQCGLLVGGHGQGRQLMASQPGPGQQRRAAGVGVLPRQPQGGEPSAAGGRDKVGGRGRPAGYQGSALVRWPYPRLKYTDRGRRRRTGAEGGARWPAAPRAFRSRMAAVPSAYELACAFAMGRLEDLSARPLRLLGARGVR